MTPWQRWVQRPQNVWLRRAFFQVHLWVGLGIGLYVLAISLSGSAIVYKRELNRKFSRKTVVVAGSGRRMSAEEVAQSAQRSYPTYEVDNIREATAPARRTKSCSSEHTNESNGYSIRIRGQIWAIRNRRWAAWSNGSPIYTTTFWREGPAGW